MPNTEVDIERILPLWQKGMSAREIGERLRRPNGMPYQARAITGAVAEARKAGDPRASRRRPGRKAMPPEERARRQRGRMLAWLAEQGHRFSAPERRDYLEGLCVIRYRASGRPVMDYTRKWGETDASKRDGQDASATP